MLIQKLIAEAEKCKEAGNSMYKQRNYEAAAVSLLKTEVSCACPPCIIITIIIICGFLQELYGDGLMLAPERQQIRAVLFANRAACYLEMQSFKEAAKDCSSAIDIDGSYIKAWHRRSKAYEGVDDMDHALKDAEKVSLCGACFYCQFSTNNAAGYIACIACPCCCAHFSILQSLSLLSMV